MEETDVIESSPSESKAEIPDHMVKIHGKVFEKLPDDLYIPPDALEVILDAFMGPLDLLLYLIRKQNIDILDIPIAQITFQYVEYVELMKGLKLELAADYLVMAAILAEIKSRMLLPRHKEEQTGEEIDPRAELVRRLQEYERFKMAAQSLSMLPREGKDYLLVDAVYLEKPEPKPAKPDVDLKEIVAAFLEVLKRSELLATHKISKEALSVRERMSVILDRLRSEKYISFTAFFHLEEGRMGVVVTFLAMLELLKESLIDMVQTEPFGPIYLKALDYETVEETDQQSD